MHLTILLNMLTQTVYAFVTAGVIASRAEYVYITASQTNNLDPKRKLSPCNKNS